MKLMQAFLQFLTLVTDKEVLTEGSPHLLPNTLLPLSLKYNDIAFKNLKFQMSCSKILLQKKGSLFLELKAKKSHERQQKLFY